MEEKIELTTTVFYLESDGKEWKEMQWQLPISMDYFIKQLEVLKDNDFIYFKHESHCNGMIYSIAVKKSQITRFQGLCKLDK